METEVTLLGVREDRKGKREGMSGRNRDVRISRCPDFFRRVFALVGISRQ
jgi:hypothetical protein